MDSKEADTIISIEPKSKDERLGFDEYVILYISLVHKILTYGSGVLSRSIN